LDAHPAGWGWFVDKTPRDDLEFFTVGDQGEQNRRGILTVLPHETGYLVGYEHGENGAMKDTSPHGIRRTPSPGAEAFHLAMDGAFASIGDEAWAGAPRLADL